MSSREAIRAKLRPQPVRDVITALAGSHLCARIR
jgi:hypothetical protein